MEVEMEFKYIFCKILKQQYEDVVEGFVYSVEAFDESGEIVNVKMTEKQIKEGGIKDAEI